MDQQNLDTLHGIADEFGQIAKKVNESSELRKEHCVKSMDSINLSMDLGETILKDINNVSESNINQRNLDNFILNTCKVLQESIKNQKKVIEFLKKDDKIENSILSNIEEKIDSLANNIEKAITTVDGIIEEDIKIIFLDKVLIMRKEYQLTSLNTLRKLSTISLEDAENAIEGSSKNLERGLDMVERLKKIDLDVTQKDKDELNYLLTNANTGWQTAKKVNESSRSQLEFSKKVNEFTEQFHENAEAIKDMVHEKHGYFEQNLQNSTVLTVVISHSFKKYLEIKNLIPEIIYSDVSRERINNLNILVDITCKEIEELSKLNYSMVDASHINNELETKTVDFTNKEMKSNDNIREEVELMTEATQYPIEGSHQNEINGKLIEENIQTILNSIG